MGLPLLLSLNRRSPVPKQLVVKVIDSNGTRIRSECSGSRIVRYDFDTVISPDRSTTKDFYKYSLTRHNTITCLLVNRAARVAFFPDLSNLIQGLTDNKPRSYRQRRKVYPLGGDIFSKITGCNI